MTNTEIEKIEIESFEGLATDESGMTTAELLGNAALAIAALVAIWGLLNTLGVNVVKYISDSIGL